MQLGLVQPNREKKGRTVSSALPTQSGFMSSPLARDWIPVIYVMKIIVFF
jgi:hypothetical protein